ncbi:MAG TPA: polysaccharide lyase family 7 protein, partial [Polyangia bacterium]
MKYLRPVFAGLCLVLSACDGIVGDPANVGGGPSGSGGAIGTGGQVGSGGSPVTPPANNGGMTGQGGGAVDPGEGAGGSGGTQPGAGGAGGMVASDAGMNVDSGRGGNTGMDTAPPPPPPSGDKAIDFSIWSLQLPTGSGTSPTTIGSSQLAGGYTSPYFYKAPDGGYMFMSPRQGITTPGSQHTRTEMRENSPGGGQAAWPSTGTNEMTVTGMVHQVGGTVAIGQLFIGTDSIPLCELFYIGSTNQFQLLYEEAKGAGQNIRLNVGTPLKTKYTFKLALNAGQLIVTINDKVAYTRRPSAGTLGKRFYFKVGNYEQRSVRGTP